MVPATTEVITGSILEIVGAGAHAGAVGVTPLGGSPGAARSIPSRPFEKMLFERIESPVPDWTSTPAATLNAMIFAWPLPVPPIVLFEALSLRMMPLISLPDGRRAAQVGADVVALDQVKRRSRSVEPDSPEVGRDHVARGCGRSADGVAAGILDQDSFARVAAISRS